jgi:hypothetical protein
VKQEMPIRAAIAWLIVDTYGKRPGFIAVDMVTYGQIEVACRPVIAWRRRGQRGGSWPS